MPCGSEDVQDEPIVGILNQFLANAPALPLVRECSSLNDAGKDLNVKKILKEAKVFIVDNAKKLKYAIAQIKERERVSVAFFRLKGKIIFDDPEEVVFSYRSNVIAIKVSTVKNIIWPLLKAEIFENEKLLKIWYDVRPSLVFLFHAQMIVMKNYCDLQVLELYYRRKSFPEKFKKAKIKKVKDANTLRPLFDFSLRMYLKVEWKVLSKTVGLSFNSKYGESQRTHDLFVAISVLFLDDLKRIFEQEDCEDKEYFRQMSIKTLIEKKH